MNMQLIIFKHLISAIISLNLLVSSNSKLAIKYRYYNGMIVFSKLCIILGIDEIDYSLYPTKEFQYQWLRVYLAHYNNIDVDDVKCNEIHKLYVQVNQFALVSHIFWAIWGLIQAEHSKIDFDFAK